MAIKLIEQSLEFIATGRLSDAKKSLEQVLSSNARNSDALHLIGVVTFQLGDHKNAARLIKKAIKYSPKVGIYYRNLGLVFVAMDDNKKAIHAFKKAIMLDRNDAMSPNDLGVIYTSIGRIHDAKREYSRSLNIEKNNPAALSNLGNLYYLINQTEKSISLYQKAIEIDPHSSKAFNGLGAAFAARGEYDKSIVSYKKALEIFPEYREAHHGLGVVLSDQGDFNSAIKSFRNAIRLDPMDAESYKNLSSIKRFESVDDDDIKSMEFLYEDNEISDDKRMHLGFAIGKALEDLGDYESSMSYIIDANKLKRKTFKYSVSEESLFIENIRGVFSERFVSSHDGVGCHDNTPIFIVGMPRSGTSLVEQILASHPDVYGAGELTELESMTADICSAYDAQFPECIINLDVKQFAQLGKMYIDKVRRYSNKHQRITDKMPHNFLRIGLIKMVLPDAKIVHCSRDPMDNCLSIYKNDFSSPHRYSYDMKELGEYYKMYSELMDYWENIFPEFMYKLSYEKLISEQESETRRLLEFCGLMWDDSCLNFHKTRRKVGTSSNAQVRRPIYKDSMRLWKRYEKELEPLRAAIYDQG